MANSGFARAILVLGWAVCSDLPAQERDATVQPLNQVVITGTLLHDTSRELASPVEVITQEQIQRSGMTTVADVVRSLSADNSGSLPTAYTGFAIGAAGASLRGLTVNSTLVLLDGRRIAGYALLDDEQRSFADLNSIPLNAVKRIEVLKDGASSIYGADAIAGVVNVILEKEYRGFAFSVEGGAGQHPGGSTRRVTATGGAGDLTTDGYNGFVSFEYQGDDRILVTDRPFPFNTDNLTSIGGLDARAGAPGSYTGSPTAIVAPAMLEPGAGSPAILNTTQVGPYQPLGACSGLGNTAASGPSAIPGATDQYCLQNRGVYFDDQEPQQRIGVTARFTVALGDYAHAYLLETYGQMTLAADAAPSSIQNSTPYNTDNIALPPTLPDGALNPNDPFAAAGQYALIQYAFANIPVLETVTNHNSRTALGVEGRFAGWDYDTALIINHTWLNETWRGLVTTGALLAAVTNGSYNFVTASANTAAERETLAPTRGARSTSDMDSIDLRATRTALSLPAGPLSVGWGIEGRYEALNSPSLDPDNSVLGMPSAYASGSRWIGSGNFEVGVPIVKRASVDLSGRLDHYSDFGSAFTPKVGIQFSPVDEVTLRGTYSSGFRAPSFAEGGSSSVENFSFISPASGSPFPDSFCAPSYHSATYCAPYYVGYSTAANTHLRPEKSDNFNLGLVLRPVAGLTASIDLYAIKKRNVITPPNTGSALAAYLSGQPLPPGYTVTNDAADPAFPNSQPRPLLVTGTYENQNALHTDGMDVALKGTTGIHSWGRVDTDFTATKIFSFKLLVPGEPDEQFVGTQGPFLLSSGAGTPRYRANWSNTYSYNSLSVTLSSYYVSGFKATAVDATGDPDSCLYTSAFCRVASFIDFDLTTLLKVNEHLTVTATVQNLADRLPPLDAANYAGERFNPTWHQIGIIGRYFKAGFNYRF